ncbi:hypothetical protein J2W80_002941 [Methylorubrum extorquens]|nr:hypothetical protein [Methylorubrum extorquens]MCP1543130.1 hypothetical protein [Methylorubrum extorquens]MCP1589525.1 hypothetical protein [Methylorubrum extorquens]
MTFVGVEEADVACQCEGIAMMLPGRAVRQGILVGPEPASRRDPLELQEVLQSGPPR